MILAVQIIFKNSKREYSTQGCGESVGSCLATCCSLAGRVNAALPSVALGGVGSLWVTRCLSSERHCLQPVPPPLPKREVAWRGKQPRAVGEKLSGESLPAHGGLVLALNPDILARPPQDGARPWEEPENKGGLGGLWPERRCLSSAGLP